MDLLGAPDTGGPCQQLEAVADGPAGSPADLDELFIAMLPQLRRGVRRMAGASQDADDIIQDLYLRLRSGDTGRRFLGHPNPAGYSAVILRNLLRDSLRQRRRAQELLVRMARTEDLRWDGGLPQRESELEVLRELRGLSERQAAVLCLVDLDGHTLDAAADLLGVHRGSVHRHRVRALQNLRARINGHRADPDQGTATAEREKP